VIGVTKTMSKTTLNIERASTLDARKDFLA
jgi:hypothetical protein